MKFSIITASYNSHQTIQRTFDSLAIQTIQDFEHIIVDGGSQDGTLELIKKNKVGRIRVISEKDSGIYDAMNKGISMASGEIIGILNSDDFYSRADVLERVQQFLINNPDIDGVYSDLVYVDQQNHNKITRLWKAGHFNPKNFYWGWMPPHPTVFFRRDVYQSVGNFNLQFQSAADYELILRACLKFGKKLHYIPGIVVCMRVGGISNASLKNRIKANAEDRLAWKVNGLKGGRLASLLKPFRKMAQFLLK